jgi:NAD(P)-dependent dehydrogenase (short-subunit alcohol dehydrogenase family)
MIDQRRPCAFVTGAGRGIGFAVALALSDVGFAVIVNDLPGSADLPQTVDAIERQGGHAQALACDISSLERQESFVEEAWTAFGLQPASRRLASAASSAWLIMPESR